MDDFEIILLCVSMFLGSYAAGWLPLFFTLDEKRLRVASIFSAGLLIGTALAVIIPEGLSTLYGSSLKTALSSNELSHLTEKTDNQLDSRPSLLNQNPAIMLNEKNTMHDLEHLDTKKEVKNIQLVGPTNTDALLLLEKHILENIHRESAVGLSLVTGFVFMFLVDNLPKIFGADGIAMGSASVSNEADLQIIVYAAIMMHKAPSAFALSNILILEGMDTVRTRRHLFLFSFSAPFSAILTYTFLKKISSSSLMPETTGIILLFSGGTFLYIAAVHVLPELMDSKRLSNVGTGSFRFSIAEMLVFVAAAFLPPIISSSLHH